MLIDKCIGKVHGIKPGRALLTLLSLTFLPLATAAGNGRVDDVVFVPTLATGNQPAEQPAPAGLADSERAYRNLVNRNALQALSPATVTASHMQPNADFRDYMLRIYDIENQAGPFAMELTEVLHTLGDMYMDQGMVDEALESFAREEYIARVNNGLYSETLLPAVKSQIRVLDASGRKQEADDKQRYLLYLLERCYGRENRRLLPDLVAYAEWNLARFHETIRYEFSENPLLSFGEGVASEAEYREKAFDNLGLAAEYFARAASMLINDRQFDDPVLYRLENRLIELAFFQAARKEILRNPDDYLDSLDLNEIMYGSGDYARLARDAYLYGVASYERQLAYIASDPAGSMARYIDILMAMGDWYVLFGRPNAGRSKYEEARDLLATLNVSRGSVARVLTPDVPVSIPVFTATTRSVGSVEQKGGMLAPYSGYIDVSFRINRNGNARNVEVLASSDNTHADIERKLVRTLLKSRFRPRFDHAELARDDEVALRYYYAYQAPGS